MNTYRITFQNEEGKQKTYTVKQLGIVPAIEEAIRKTFCLARFHGYLDIVKVEMI